MVSFNLLVLLMLSLGGVLAHTSYITEEAEKIESISATVFFKEVVSASNGNTMDELPRGELIG
jgi:hypothetical protein